MTAFACLAGTLLCLLQAPRSFAGIAERVQHGSIAGIDAYAYGTSIEDVIVLQGWFPAGDVFCADGNPSVASLTAGMLDKGTTAHGKFEIARQLEALGASIGFQAGPQVVTFSARCLKQDLPVVVSLLAEQLRSPAFDAAEFEKLQKQFTGSLQRQLENTGTLAEIALSRAVFPVGHPNRPATIEELIAGVAAAKVEDLRQFHAEHYGPAHMQLVAVGDVNLPVLQPELEKGFAGWSGGTPLPAAATRAGKLDDTAREQVVFVPGKTSVNVLMGQADGLRYRDGDALALRAATAIFGTGFTGRLMANVRDKEGLTYGVYAGTDEDTFADGSWEITGTFAPALLEKGVVSIRRQLDIWYRDGVTAAELDAKKENMIGKQQVGMATTAGLAGTIAATLQRGQTLDWLDRYPEAVQALTVQQVNDVIKRRLDPERMVLIKAGTVASPQAP